MYRAVICIAMISVAMISASLYGDDPLRIWCLGDSITRGNSTVAPPRASYRKDLFGLLNNAGLNYDFVGTRNNNDSNFPTWTDQDHDGWGSYTSANLLNGADWSDNGGPGFLGVAAVVGTVRPDIVLLHIGSNDCAYYSDAESGVAATMNNIQGIIAAVRNYNPNAMFFVANMIPGNTTPEYQSMNNALAAAITDDVESYSTQSSPVHLVDMRTGYDPTWYVSDMVHPDVLGETFMAGQWADAILTEVPEPATVGLITIGLAAILHRKRYNK